VSFHKCDINGDCVDVCRYNALALLGKSYSVDQLVQLTLRDIKYYNTSGGGVTLSGGEPLAQPLKAVELAKALQSEGIHVCLDTSAYASTEDFVAILDHINLLHLDYKIADSDQHRKYTGRGNARILRNLKIANQAKKDIILRCPIIPGINDNIEHFNAIIDLANTYDSILGVEILSYHNFGKSKARKVGMENNYPSFPLPDDPQKESWKDFIASQVEIPVSVH
jgi:pyruvate formate lyase activating enzyme